MTPCVQPFSPRRKERNHQQKKISKCEHIFSSSISSGIHKQIASPWSSYNQWLCLLKAPITSLELKTSSCLLQSVSCLFPPYLLLELTKYQKQDKKQFIKVPRMPCFLWFFHCLLCCLLKSKKCFLVEVHRTRNAWKLQTR